MNSNAKLIIRWVVLTAAMGAAACSSYYVPAARKLAADEEPKLKALIADAEAAYNDRHNGEKLRRAIALYGQAIALDPTNIWALTRLARANYDLAYAYLTDTEQKKQTFFKAREYGLRALKTNAAFARALDSGASYMAAVQFIEKTHIGALAWTASSWGRWGELMGVTNVALDIPKVKAMIDRVRKLDHKNNFGGPHRFLGAYYIKIPRFAGQDPKRAKRHFLKAIEIAPGFLENRLLYAEYYAPHADDQALFKEQLQMILDAPDDRTVPYRLENMVAKRRAAEMMKDIDKYF